MTKLSKSTKKFEKKRLQKVLERRREIKKIKNKYKSIKKKNIQKNDQRNKELKRYEHTDADSPLNGVFDVLSEPSLSDNESNDISLSSNDDHKTQLYALKDKDPEFYKYLQEEEAELLAFEDSDTSDKKIDDTSQEAEADHKLLTLSVLNNWEKILIQEKSLKMLQKVVVTLHKISQLNKKTSSSNPFVADLNVFNIFIVLVFKYTPLILHHHFPIKTYVHKENIHNEKKKKKMFFILRTQFSNILHFLDDLTDPNMLQLMLEETEKLIPYALTHRKFIKYLIKLVIKLWSTQSQNEVKNAAYNVIKKIFLMGDKHFIEHGLKAIYIAFIQQSSQTNAITMPVIHSMKEAVSELFGINQIISYQVSFKCIRQLAIHLRNAIIKHDEESYKIVYNWKYVHSIDFWSLVLSNYCDKTKKGPHPFPMQDLIYPLVQVTLGAIKHASSSQFFPLRFHLIRSLIRISYHTGVYIPLGSYIFEILESKEIKNKPNLSTAKPIDFELCICAPKSYLKGKVYQNGLIEQIIELLLEIYSLQCTSISFPELVIPVIIQIKRYIKQSKNSKLNKHLITFIEKLKENSEFIESQRESIEFSPDNMDEINAFLKDYDWDKTPLGKYTCFQRRIKKELKQIESEHQEQDANQVSSEAEDSMDINNFDDYSD